MNDKLVFLWLFMFVLICSCINKSEKVNWQLVRKSKEAYPRDSVTMDTLKYFDNISNINWVNKGYINYPFKKYASEFVNLTFDVKSHTPFNLINDSLGRYSIEKDILQNLRTKGIAHLVCKKMNSVNFQILLYLENDSVSFLDCEELLKHMNLKIPYTIQVQQDKEWNQFFSLVNKK
jgi:hypothetical protein